MSYARAVKYLEETINWSGGDGETLTEMFFYDHPEYNPDNEGWNGKPYPKRLMNEWAKRWAEAQIFEVERDIEYELNEADEIKIWRVITAPETWEPDNRDLGVYWSWDKNAAEAHWGNFAKGNVKWRIASVAKRGQIDWQLTLALNASPSLGKTEKEIRLKAGSKVPILGLEVTDADYRNAFYEVPIDGYRGKKYAANPRRRR